MQKILTVNSLLLLNFLYFPVMATNSYEEEKDNKSYISENSVSSIPKTFVSLDQNKNLMPLSQGTPNSLSLSNFEPISRALTFDKLPCEIYSEIFKKFDRYAVTAMRSVNEKSRNFIDCDQNLWRSYAERLGLDIVDFSTDYKKLVQNYFKPSIKLISTSNFTPKSMILDGSIVYGTLDETGDICRAAQITMAEQKTEILSKLHNSDVTFIVCSDDSGSKIIGFSEEDTTKNMSLVEWDRENNVKLILSHKEDFVPFCSNSDGSILVGHVSNNNILETAYKLTAQGLESLPNLKGGIKSGARYIDSHSNIVGYSIDEQNNKTAVIWTTEGIQPLPMLNGGKESEALFSNPKLIIGHANDGSDNNKKKIVQWIQGKIYPLQERKAEDYTFASANKDGSLIFGHTKTKPFIWVDGNIKTLLAYLKDSKIFPRLKPLNVSYVSPDGSDFIMEAQNKNNYVVHRPRLDLF